MESSAGTRGIYVDKTRCLLTDGWVGRGRGRERGKVEGLDGGDQQLGRMELSYWRRSSFGANARRRVGPARPSAPTVHFCPVGADSGYKHKKPLSPHSNGPQCWDFKANRVERQIGGDGTNRALPAFDFAK